MAEGRDNGFFTEEVGEGMDEDESLLEEEGTAEKPVAEDSSKTEEAAVRCFLHSDVW